VAIALFCKFALKFDINWKEFLIQLGGGVVALSLIWCIGRYSAADDQEVWNGYVMAKHVDHFTCPMNTSNPCRNGYTCNSRQVCSGSGKDQVCHEEHDTCYTYAWEQDWYVDSNIGSMEIERVDRQGADEPGRYSIVSLNDPVSKTHDYKNWVKAAADSIYAQDQDAETRYASLIPQYQQRLYDYYKLDHFYAANLKPRNAADWNLAIATALGPIGSSKQINFLVVVVQDVNRDYAQALRRSWNGFKKNEAVLVIGLRDGNIEWAESMSWSKNSIYDVDVRNMVEDRSGTAFASIDPNEFMGQVTDIIKKDYVRRPMKEFEYLKGDIPPPNWLIILAIAFATIYGVGTSILFHKYEI